MSGAIYHNIKTLCSNIFSRKETLKVDGEVICLLFYEDSVDYNTGSNNRARGPLQMLPLLLSALDRRENIYNLTAENITYIK